MTHFDEKDLLTRELRERSSDVGGHPIGFDAVRSSARRIRRRRTVVAGAVAVAVAGVALPTGLAVTSALDPDGRRAPDRIATSPTPDPTPAPAPTPRADGTFPLTVHGLPRGEEAGARYVVRDTKQLETPAGPVDLPEAYSMITPYDDGWLAVGSSRNPEAVVMLDSSLEVTHTDPAGGFDLAVSDDGSHVAYTVRESGDRVLLVNAPTDGTDVVTWPIDVPGAESLDPVGFLDDDTVVYNSDAGEVMGIARTGGSLTPIEGVLRVDDASEAAGLVSVLVSYGVDGGCSGVQDPTSGALLWKSCEHSNLRFSPDGRLVVADASYYDGPGSPTLSVLDARTGDEVVTFTPERRDTVVGVSQAVWEDDDTVLAHVDEGGDQAMVRLGTDGSTEAVTDVVKVRDMSLALWFAEDPRR